MKFAAYYYDALEPGAALEFIADHEQHARELAARHFRLPTDCDGLKVVKWSEHVTSILKNGYPLSYLLADLQGAVPFHLTTNHTGITLITYSGGPGEGNRSYTIQKPSLELALIAVLAHLAELGCWRLEFLLCGHSTKWYDGSECAACRNDGSDCVTGGTP